MNAQVKKYLLVVVMVVGMVMTLGGNKVEASEKVDINAATIEELQKLEGVGAPLAQKIIDARPYKSVDELKDKVSGIGAAKLKAIQDQGLAVAESFPAEIDLNKASLYDLQFLAGVGAPLAQKIIDARPYKSVDELKDKVNGIGDVKLQAIKDQGLAKVSIFPAKIKDVFPDPNFASVIADKLSKNVEDEVTKEELIYIRFESNATVNLSKKNIANLEGIQYLNIATLDLSFNEITDISPLSQLPNISSLYLDNNKIDDITPLSKLTKLSRLRIYNNQIKDISCLKSLNLWELWAGNNEIEDISAVKEMTNLSLLQLQNNKIKNVEAIANLHEKMEKLTLGDNEIEELFSLEKFNKLTNLGLYRMKLKNVDAFRGRTRIPDTNLEGNEITNLDGFSDLEICGTIRLKDNHISVLPEFSKLKLGKFQINDQTADLDSVVVVKNQNNVATIPLVLKDKDGNFLVPKNLSKNLSYSYTSKQLQKRECTEEKETVGYEVSERRPVNEQSNSAIGIYFDCEVKQPVVYAADKTDIQSLYDSMSNIEKGSYTEKSWGNFQAELSKTKQILEKLDATKDEVDQAKKDLQTAHDALIIRAENKSDLKAFVEKVDKLYWGQDYSSGYIELIRACSAAEKIIDDEDASQIEVDNTLAELKKLEENLVLKGNAAIPLDQRLAEARAKFLELINEERKSKDMNTLAYSDGLNSLADVRAEEQQILYSHTRPNGSNVLYAGQKYGFTFLDECLTDSLFRDSYGYQKSGEDIGQTMFDSWKSSSAHYNIMVRTTRQTHIGLSFVVNNRNTFRMYGVLLVGWN